MFLGDQGRDALIVANIFRQPDLIFIGPVTSVGNMYLGPLYYYFMVPFLMLTYPSPVGPAYAVAVLSVLAVPLMYFWGRKMIGERAALISAFLMTFSWVVVLYSRFSWNPNPAPIVAIGMIYATYLAWQKNKWYWVVVSLCFSVLIQLHYLTLLMAGGAGLIWLWQLWETARLKKTVRPTELKRLILSTLLAAAIFVASLTPLILFDYRHDGLNAKAFQSLFTQEEILAERSGSSPVAKMADMIKGSHGQSIAVLFESSFGRNVWINSLMLLLVVAVVLKVLSSKHPHQAGYITVVVYLVTSILGMAAYEHTIFNHYTLFALPAAFWLLGLVLAWMSRHKLGAVLVIGWLAAYLFFNLPEMPLTKRHESIYDYWDVTRSLETKLQPGEAYSLVLLAPSGDSYAQNYRYFLSTTDKPALPPERATEAETLVVINEEHLDNVPDLPIYEIVTFPEKNPSEVYTIPDGPEIWIFRK